MELLALGCANLDVAVTGGYPVNGGVSRSVVKKVRVANIKKWCNRPKSGEY